MITEKVNVQEALRSLILSGSYLGIGTGATVSSVEAAFGMAEHVVMKKGQKTMKYPWGSVVFESQSVHQFTFSAMNVTEAQDVKQLLMVYQNEQIDRVEGYFRYFRVMVQIPHVQEILFNTADEENASLVSVAVVFPPSDTVETSVKLQKKQYELLRKMSTSTRETIPEICAKIIEQYLTEHSEK
ncbi:MAG: hypothetical protein PHD21_04635 [Flavobacteriales bacterium]|nr:hypothetical protein [Flavobacteriales bacterium]